MGSHKGDLDRSLKLHELLTGVEVSRVWNDANPVVTAVCDDSRTVTPGSVFIAVPGEKADGHAYIGDAVARGAAAVVCEAAPSSLPDCPVIQVPDSRAAASRLADRFFGSPARRVRVTGITGTDGKTSTTELLRNILNEAGRRAGTIGTLGYCIGGRWTDLDLTTPGPIALHGIFSRMVESGMTDVCMEVSSHSLAQRRVADIPFAAAVLTNITHDHLDFHGTRENYAAAKRILFEGLPEGAVAVLPADSDFFESFAASTRAEVLTYGIGRVADVRGRIVSLGLSGMVLEVTTPQGAYEVRTSLIGSYNCLNILAAATAAFGYGVAPEAVRAGLRAVRGVPGRLERLRVPGRSDLPAVCVDFAHTPDALEKVLTTLRPLVRGRLICVVGCGGDRDKTKRPRMGDAATRLADVAVFTADNSRSEATDDIIRQIVAGVSAPFAQYRVEPDRRRAMEVAIELAPSPDSMVVICGRGCERYQKIGGQLIPFDDRYVAREIMQRMPLRRRKTA